MGQHSADVRAGVPKIHPLFNGCKVVSQVPVRQREVLKDLGGNCDCRRGFASVETSVTDNKGVELPLVCVSLIPLWWLQAEELVAAGNNVKIKIQTRSANKIFQYMKNV